MLSESKIKKLEKVFGIKIKDINLFENSLTHSSYTKENELSAVRSYERLEFLGDAVLKLFTSEILYKTFKDYDEGKLTKIRSIVVSDNILAEIALEMGLSEFIILGRQELKSGGRDKKSILACAFESLLGAYYLQGDGEKLLRFLEEKIRKYIQDADENFEKFNSKAVLQEYTQSKNKHLPKYNIINEKGPEHDKIFTVEVSYDDKVIAKGKGKTKREAEQAAAYEACIMLDIIKGDK